MPSSALASMTTIDQFISQVGQTLKQADDGGKPMSEPGSIGGETSHPVGKVDDRLHEKKEGERFRENTKDVNEDQGAPSVQHASEAKAGSDSLVDLARRFARPIQKQAGMGGACPKCGASPCKCSTKKAEGGAVMQGGSAEEDHLQMGTKVAPTGEDPKSETESAKAGKEDPGSTHPARTDNSEIDGHKWAVDSNTSLEALTRMMKQAGDNLCATVFQVSQNSGNNKTAAAAQQAAGGKLPQQKQAGEVDPWLAQQVGWEMAGLVTGNFDKRAADSMVVNTMYDIVKTANDDADNFINYMQALQKEAEGEMPPPGAGGAPMGPPPGPEGAPEGGGDAGGMMAALGGGADAGGGAGGGPAPDGGGGAMGGPGGGDHEAMQLAQILEHLGVSPEELEQALQEQQGGGGGMGGGPPMGDGGDGGGPPMGGPGGAPMGPGGGEEKPAHDRRGQQKQAGTKVAEMHKYISEIVQRSRSRR